MRRPPPRRSHASGDHAPWPPALRRARVPRARFTARCASGLRALHAWLDTWHGIGLIEHGLARQERDLELIRYGDRWGAAVYWTGHVHATVQATDCQRSPYSEPPGSGKLSHPGSPILSQAGSPMLSHPGAGMLSHPAAR
jgi:hypothetical protein